MKEEKAEQRALEAYPVLMCYNDFQMVEEDVNKPLRKIYQEGYHQAEKDLDVVSWVKEVSGVKEMSRAKEEALKAYPPISIAANYDTIARRDAFEYGYLKAEKDLGLTWEDVKQICDIAFEEACRLQRNMKSSHIYKEQYYQEVLKRI